jgi:hypothetical protein
VPVELPSAPPIRTLARVFRSPSPAALWELRADLLEAGLPPDARSWALVDRFRGFLEHLATTTTAREYSRFASKLDIGAIGGVVLEHLLEFETAQQLALRVLTGLLGEGLMVLATRQHIKAWDHELSAVYSDAAWFLYGELWSWAEQSKPEVPPRERRRLLDALVAPVRAADTPGEAKAVVVGVLFQVLLAGRVVEEVSRRGDATGERT